jgi:hypothetical protein
MGQKKAKSRFNLLAIFPLLLIFWQEMSVFVLADTKRSPNQPEQTVECEMLIVGAGLAGSAAAYEGLLAGKTVCLTEITDWVGGQISSQGTSALDERPTQAKMLFYPRGYLDFRRRIQQEYDSRNPGDCWVSESCFLPSDGDTVLMAELRNAERKGQGKLKWFPSTVIKDLKIKLNFELNFPSKIMQSRIDIGINNFMGDRVAWLSSNVVISEFSIFSNSIEFLIKDLPLAPGDYTLNLFSEINNEIADWLTEVMPFTIIEKDYYKTGKLTLKNQGNILLNFYAK